MCLGPNGKPTSTLNEFKFPQGNQSPHKLSSTSPMKSNSFRGKGVQVSLGKNVQHPFFALE